MFPSTTWEVGSTYPTRSFYNLFDYNMNLHCPEIGRLNYFLF